MVFYADCVTKGWRKMFYKGLLEEAGGVTERVLLKRFVGWGKIFNQSQKKASPDDSRTRLTLNIYLII